MKKIKLTIITALLEFDTNLIETFDSIKELLFEKKLKWVIKYSKKQAPDEMLELFSGYENISIIECYDNSVYEALNECVDLVDTEYFLVLGSGDKFADGALLIIEKEIEKNKADGFIFSSEYPKFINYPKLDEIHYRMPGSHQGMVLNTKKVISLGKFNTCYKFTADYDLICKYYLKYPNIITSQDVISIFKGQGMSHYNKFECALELYLIAHKYWKSRYKNLEFNETIIQNLTYTNEVVKKDIMEKNTDLQIQEINTKIDILMQALELAHQDFTNLYEEVQSMKISKQNMFQKKPTI